jgi:ribosome-associated toxin RatA of RatAB toxin-antitoxin module
MHRTVNRENGLVSDLTYAESITVQAPPSHVYDIVSDVTRTGEWSPICKQCWWDDGGGPRVGAWFTGRNETPRRTWQTRSQVIVAEPEREFAFLVGEGYVRWGFALAPVEGGGTELTESWEFRPEGLAMFAERYGDRAQQEVADRTEAAHKGIPASLAAIKRIAESR